VGRGFSGKTLIESDCFGPGSRRKDNIRIDFKKKNRGHGLGYLTQDREKWRVLVNTVINILVPQNA
jgi:hypothetical protein